MKVTYWNTLYKREVTENTDSIYFSNDGTSIIFMSIGQKTRIPIKYVRKIENIED